MNTKKYRDAYKIGKKFTKKSYILLLVLIVCGWYAFDYYTQQNRSLESNPNVTLAKCTDGDTAHFYIDGNKTKVRFLAIDTPESVKANTPVQPYGKEASEYTCTLLENADSITLEYEEEKSDKYDRTLAWVFVDDELLQEKLVANGYAKVAYLYDTYKYTPLLEKAEKKAKQEKQGIWSK